MDPILKTLLWIVGIGAVSTVAAFLAGILTKKSQKQKIEEKFQKLLPEASVLMLPDKDPYQLRIETNNIDYLVKVIRINPRHELILTNPNSWCVNDNPGAWKRSTQPLLVNGVRDFLDTIYESEKKVVRLALVYPDCRNITRYLNESDVEVVTYKKAVYGVVFVRFSELELFFKK